ncbi:MAG: DUF309 domain-containing protein [Desulfobacteraceae bacterium]|nr:DUF309 domain-containing protein [Desulfobacteraceae bacterium]
MILKTKRPPTPNAPGGCRTALQASETTAFDPFADRCARDLRNSLAKALAKALASGRPDGYRQLARRWRAGGLSTGCLRYLEERLGRYEQAMAACQALPDRSPLMTARVLWNLGLFFEVHEVVEEIWHTAIGGRREALKGLVQAAGVFVHREAGRNAPAARLATRASQRLARWGRYLPEIGNLEELLTVLAAYPASPCRLQPAAAGGGRGAGPNVQQKFDRG